jgi:hypothetical protein
MIWTGLAFLNCLFRGRFARGFISISSPRRFYEVRRALAAFISFTESGVSSCSARLEE